MSEYIIIADSTTDLSADMEKKLGIITLPLSFTIGGKTYKNYLDGSEMTNKVFYSKLRNGEMSSTSQLNPDDFTEAFEAAFKEGKDVLYIGFSSGLSGTYQSANIAKADLEGKYPDRKLYCIDSRAASMGQGLLVYEAVARKNKGLSIDELKAWVDENILKLCHWFTVDDLHHLKRGGRVSAAAAVVGTMLGIKPVLHVDNEGRLIPVTKIRGRKPSLDALVAQIEKTAINAKEQTMFISHVDCLEDANYVEKLIKDKFKCKTVINEIGPVIGAHAGPGTIALFFFGNER